MKKILLLTALCMLTTISTAAQAESDGSFLSFGVGYYDIMDDKGAVDLRAEYRPNVPVLVESLRPWLGAEITSDLSVWAGGGLLYDWEFSPNWHAVPSLGAGLYAHGSSDLDLGHAIEFRSQLEVAHQFETGQRAGLAFGHISNAGLDSENPGTEVLNVYYHIPY